MQVYFITYGIQYEKYFLQFHEIDNNKNLIKNKKFCINLKSKLSY